MPVTLEAKKRSTEARTMKAFSANLYAAREAAGLSQKELGEMIGVTQGQIGHFENCRRNPSLSDLCKLADALGTSVADLIAT